MFFFRFYLFITLILDLSLPVFSKCGIRKLFDIVIVYDESGSVDATDWNYEKTFMIQLADDVFVGPDSANMAAVSVSNIGTVKWNLRDNLNVASLTEAINNQTLQSSSSSDVSPGWDKAWTDILSTNMRTDGIGWIITITDTITVGDGTSINAAKAAGIKSVIVAAKGDATAISSYATDSSHMFSTGSEWAGISEFNDDVMTLFCPAYCEVLYFYSVDPSTMLTSSDGLSNVAYYLDGAADIAYNIHCCGAITTLEFNSTIDEGEFTFQLWRSNVLVAQQAITTTIGLQTYTFSPKIAIKADDVFGWFAVDENPIGKASCSGDLCTHNVRRVTPMAALEVGMSFTWSSYSGQANTAYAIKVTSSNNSAPTFISPFHKYISEVFEVGKSVMDYTFTDEDGDELTCITCSNSYFFWNITSGIVFLTAHLPLTGVESSYIFDITVVDMCSNTVTATINFTSFAGPPTFHNLPNEVEVADNIREETLIYTVNVTDLYTTTIPCTLTEMLPDTDYFRLDDYANGTVLIYLNNNASLDWDDIDEYKMFISCTGTSVLESLLTIKLLDMDVTTPYVVPAWTAGAIAVSVSSMAVVIAIVCFLIGVMLITTDEAEALPPPEPDDESEEEEEEEEDEVEQIILPESTFKKNKVSAVENESEISPTVKTKKGQPATKANKWDKF